MRFRDGRVAPFEPDLLSQILFAATEAIGAANAFLARELADGVLHFLAEEDFGDTASAEQIAETAAKVLHQLGQPELAHSFLDQWPTDAPPPPTQRLLQVPFTPGDEPATLVRRCLEEYSMRAVFAPDVAAAHRDGLIRLGNLSAPDRLSGIVLDPSIVDFGRDRAGSDWIVDGADWWLSEPADAVANIARNIAEAADDALTDIWLHLHAGEPPAWAQNAGPLFAAGSKRTEPPSAIHWLAALAGATPRLHPIWHWHGDAIAQSIFLEAGRALGPRGGILFERPRRPFVLSRGTNRQRPAVLLEVELHLSRLLDLPEVASQADRLVEKLPSLARLAISAAVQKRKYLRRHAESLGRAFLLDRAMVRLIPCGLDAVIRRLMNVGTIDTKLARGFARRLLALLHRLLETEHRKTALNLSLAAPPEPIDIAGTDAKARLAAWSDVVRGVTDGVVGFAWPDPPHDLPIELLPLLDYVSRETDLAGFVWSVGHVS